jgi:hypothetical protein
MKRAALSISLATAIAISAFAAEKGVRVDLDRERAGREPARFLAVVGDWTIVWYQRRRARGHHFSLICAVSSFVYSSTMATILAL